MKEVVLPGVDGSTLLGFLAALGVLRGLTDSVPEGHERPRLRWIRGSTWNPAVSGVADIAGLSSRLLLDAHSRALEDVVNFEYLKREKAGPKRVQSLAPPVAVLRAALMSRLAGNWAAAHFIGCLMCESAVDEIPEAKCLLGVDLDLAGIDYDRGAPLDLAVAPTPFDFTSRNTQFLDQIKRIRDALTEATIEAELLYGVGAPVDRIMRWDALVDMPGALFDRARPMTRPVAEWLAFRGLAFFPLVAAGPHARVAGLSGRRKAGKFAWALWSRPLPPDVITSTLGIAWGRATRAERLERGLTPSFTVSLRKDATGYDGSVSPSQALQTSG